MEQMGMEFPKDKGLLELIPEAAPYYDEKLNLDVFLMTTAADEEAKEAFASLLKASIKKDHIELMLPIPFEIVHVLSKGDANWPNWRYETFRKGFVTIKLKITLKKVALPSGNNTIQFKLEGGFKQVSIYNMDGEEMEDE